MFNVSGKVVVITGGVGGIGLVCAKRLADAGASVWLVSRRADGHTAAERVGAQFRSCDITDEESVRAMFATVVDAEGRIDVLVHAADIHIDPEPLLGSAAYDLQRAYEVNVIGAFHCIKHAAPLMPRGSSIINLGSIGGLMGSPSYAYHTTSKYALNGLGRAATIDLGPAGIRVNTICPAMINTQEVVDSAEHFSTEVALSRTASTMDMIPEPEHVAGLVHFLASDDSAGISGQEIAVDAGITAGWSVGLQDAVVHAHRDPGV